MNKAILNQSIIAGVICGIIFTAFSFGTYYTGITSFTGFSFIYKFLPLVIVVLLILGFKLRRQMGGFLSFKEALQFAFVAYLAYEIICLLVNYILFSVIDPQLTKKVFDTTIQTTANFMKSMGSSQAEIDEMLKSSQKQRIETGSKNILLGLGTYLIWDFVLSLLIAVIIKKEQPVDIDIESQPVIKQTF